MEGLLASARLLPFLAPPCLMLIQKKAEFLSLRSHMETCILPIDMLGLAHTELACTVFSEDIKQLPVNFHFKKKWLLLKNLTLWPTFIPGIGRSWAKLSLQIKAWAYLFATDPTTLYCLLSGNFTHWKYLLGLVPDPLVPILDFCHSATGSNG